MNNKFKIIVPFYNVEKWLEKCIVSIKNQSDSNYQCVLIDDISTDNSYKIAEELTKDDENFVLIKNTEKKYALKNIIDGIQHLQPEDEDVIVTIDGDDWLPDNDVFSFLRKTYTDEDCLMTYGNYVQFPSGRMSTHCSAYPKFIIKNRLYRKDSHWRASHLRTFKYKLWKNIKNEDFLDEDGKYLDVTWDLCFMFPMLEMSGERQKFIDRPMYVYNMSNPNSDFRIKLQRQLYYDRVIRNRERYDLLQC